MATWCLTKQQNIEFKKKLKDGTINPVTLANMDSLARREFLAKFVGEENASNINALFESKLLLKNQKAGYISWAKNVAGISSRVRMDLISRIERMDKILSPEESKQFLNDLANRKLGIEVTQEEAQKIVDLSKIMRETRAKADELGVFPSEEARLKYGESAFNLKSYVDELKLANRAVSIREQPVKAFKKAVIEIPSTAKSIVASLDNSFFGRQGIKTLYTNPKIWMRAFLKSWGDITKELGGRDAVALIKADIYSRPNALNGKYQVGNYGLNVMSEEAFPSSLPERIPVFGKLFKASEAAYNGAALRLRADLADKYIKLAEENGLNMLNKEDAQGVGQLVSSLTGRGSLGKADVLSKEINVLLFSAKFLKSNFDVLTAHAFDPKASKFVKKEAAKNLLRIVGTVASILGIAKALDPDSVDEDPRSSNFGKIKVFGHWTDITGGAASLVTLASRLVPSTHNGELGMWQKSSTGKYTNLLAGEYGQNNALDVLENFIEGKLAPVAGILRDVWTGRTYEGTKPTIASELTSLFVPISLQTFSQLNADPNSTSVLGSLILDGLGLSVSTNNFKSDWSQSSSKELQQFKQEVGSEKFNEANDKFNNDYAVWFNKVSTSKDFKELSDDNKAAVISKKKENLKADIFREYKFKYKQDKTPAADLRKVKDLAK